MSVGISHRTIYRYRQPVNLGPHRLMLRPRESRELLLNASNLLIEPKAKISWAHDVFGNAVATATFQGPTDSLLIQSTAEIELKAAAWPVFNIAADAISYPFRYSEDDWTDLGPLSVQQYPDEAGEFQTWVRAFVMGDSTDTLSLLKDLGIGVSSWIAYRSREEEGTQSPLETLRHGSGSCRDFATLFVESVRCLGFGARVVSGYLHDESGDDLGSEGAGSTHAWAEVYIPGAGWITFDPTNRSIGGVNLISVAVARDIRQAIPVSGSFAGPADALVEMDVNVLVVAQ